ncbi:MAG: hypothetical protein CMH57_06560 [Myxococcales bacterium]|nr:hypothetical protein [Myxococcales bacterium]
MTLPLCRRAAALTATLLAVSLAPAAVHAHPTSMGNTLIHVKPASQDVDLFASVARNDLGEYLKLDQDGNNVTDEREVHAQRDVAIDYMASHLRVTNGGQPCPPVETRLIPSSPDKPRVNLMMTARCAAPLGSVTIANRILFEDRGGHRHTARIQLGEEVYTTVFSREAPDYTLQIGARHDSGGPIPHPDASSDDRSLGAVALRYTWEGILHILIGLDHVLFVLCLLLIARELKPLLLVVTAFTVSHSVTLVASALDLMIVPAAIIEPVIALSILVIAIENIVMTRRDEEPKHRPILTGLFGLVHGFGFSYVLCDEVGLPSEALLPALLTFNVGVELGQLAIILIAWPLLRLAMKRDGYPRAVQAMSGVIGALAVWWFIERTLLT